MPKPTATAGSNVGSTTPESVPALVDELRASFDADATRSREWRIGQLKAMAKLLEEGEEELTKAVYADSGKSPFECKLTEIALAKQECYDFIQELDEMMADEAVGTNLFTAPAESVIQKDPLGVVLVIGAWNYSILLALQPVIGAIAAGNSVILKPGSYSVNAGDAIERLMNKYMDTSTVKCVTGNRHVTSALLECRFDLMFFTGSPYVGKIIAQAAAKQLCPVVLELGGKSPVVVDKSANLEVAARRLVWGRFVNCGQTCVAPDYACVHADIAERFSALLQKTVKDFYTENPKETPWFARVINDSAFDRLKKCVDDSPDRLICGGQTDKSQRYIAPSIFDFKKDWSAFESSELMQDEIFGPLLPIVTYDDLDAQVVPFIRARPKPLAMYIFAEDRAMYDGLLRKTTSGGAIVNDCMVHLSNPDLPFGGVGDSGQGSYHGHKSFDTFSHRKSVLKRGTALDSAFWFRYPPYNNTKMSLLDAAFNMPLNFYFRRAAHFLGDKKNLLIMLLIAFIVKQQRK